MLDIFKSGNSFIILISLSVVFLLAGCFKSIEESGVTNKWRDPSLPPIEKGTTTQAEILEMLGPPSQVINLENQVVFYYLLEKTENKGAFLMLFNWKNKRVKYDRAIFFFDKNGVLDDYAFSIENVGYVPN
jgi:outer membrane protein assembly factor BamE (lipoprotein component of BamABCDE complex)